MRLSKTKENTYNMNMKKLTTASAMYSQGSYISPAVRIVDIQAEGLLCVSMIKVMSLEIDPWEEDDEFIW